VQKVWCTSAGGLSAGGWFDFHGEFIEVVFSESLGSGYIGHQLCGWKGGGEKIKSWLLTFLGIEGTTISTGRK
jgi:hypothetical protein